LAARCDFEFKKRRQFSICTHNETLSVVAMRKGFSTAKNLSLGSSPSEAAT